MLSNSSTAKYYIDSSIKYNTKVFIPDIVLMFPAVTHLALRVFEIPISADIFHLHKYCTFQCFSKNSVISGTVLLVY